MKNIKTLIDMIKQLNTIITAKQKRESVVLFCIVFIGALFELLGVSVIFPFIESILNVEELAEKWYIKPIVDLLHINNNITLITCMGIAIIVVYIVKNVYLSFSMYVQYSFRYNFQKQLSVRTLMAYLKRPYSYFLNINSAEVLRSINGDVIGVFGIYEYFFKMLSEILTVALIAGLLIYTDAIMALGLIILSAVCFLGVTGLFRWLLKGAGERQRNADMETSKIAYQSINGIKEINVMKRNSFFVNHYETAYERKAKAERLSTFLGGCPERIIEMVCISGMIGMVCVRIQFGVNPVEFVPKLAAFAVAAFKILPAISKMIGYISGLIYQRPALEAAYNNFREIEEFEKLSKDYMISKSSIINRENISFRDTIEIKAVSWKYPNARKNVLTGLDLTIKKGQAIALIGTSGAGKTTLSDIVLGLFMPQAGEVLVDGVDIYSIPHEWARMIGYVPQTVYLLDDTIRNNIAFGIETDEIDDRLIWKTLKQAQLEEFVKQLPDGLDTLVGERGVRFSGGQRQRVAIARALYYNPDILVLDEATSALDNETEKAVMESIDMLQGNKTLIIVAHRLTTVQKCDIIYEIKDGKAFMVDKKKLGAK